MRFTSLLAACWLLGGLAAFSQNHFEQSESRSPSSPISYEAVALFNADSSTMTVNVHYRIGQNFFIFVRNERAPQRSDYVARGELLVELVNEQKVSVARQILQLPLTRTTLPRDSDRPISLQGVISLQAPPGKYTIVFSVDDRESGRAFIEKTRKVASPEPKPAALYVSDLIMCRQPVLGKQPQLFVPMNRGGNVLFADAGGFLTEVFLPSALDTLRLTWKLTGQAEGFGERIQKLEGSTFTILDGVLHLLPQEQGVLYGLKAIVHNWKAIYVPLPLEKLQPGAYTLEVQYRLGKAYKMDNHEFRVSWPSHPFSLTDPELAVDALRHIAKESEIDGMLSGSAERRSDAFYRFWKERSRDTTTAYNHALAEYYFRVDEAMRKFSTAKENDGYKTDRGRIYILYGPPPKSERVLQPSSGPKEIWTYERVQRRFIFIDPARNGNYILSQAENL
ncbi:MAG: GWxTD domain-containing protein [Ignavibacteriales bacterium]|nr:GWxTD domain-containing protein [Ignavibacteriales bacterium]